MTSLTWLTLLGCTTILQTSASADHNPRAQSAQLNGKHHLLRIQPPDTVARETLGDEAADLARFAVGARMEVTIPGTLGTGHGPFFDVHAGAATVSAREGLQIDGQSVRCERAGTFELVVDSTDLDGHAIRDAADIGCIEPTRVVAEAAGRYLAGASTIYPRFVPYGRAANGSEVELLGTAPTEVAPGETMIARVDRTDVSGFRALARGSHPSVRWGKLTAQLPIEIVDADWKVELAVTVNKGSRGSVTEVQAGAVDAHGAAIVVETCALETRVGADRTHREGCSIYLKQKPDAADHTADRACATVLGQTTCKAIPRG